MNYARLTLVLRLGLSAVIVAVWIWAVETKSSLPIAMLAGSAIVGNWMMLGRTESEVVR